MRRLRHLVLLLRDVLGISRYTGAAWLAPLIILFLVFLFLAIASQGVVPYVVYTFF